MLAFQDRGDSQNRLQHALVAGGEAAQQFFWLGWAGALHGTHGLTVLTLCRPPDQVTRTDFVDAARRHGQRFTRFR